jgi:hypothetical protein
MGRTRALATYVDLDGKTKRYVDMDEETSRYVDLVGTNVLLLVAGAPWPVKERAFMAAISTMTKHEVQIAIRFMRELDESNKYYERIEASWASQPKSN